MQMPRARCAHIAEFRHYVSLDRWIRAAAACTSENHAVAAPWWTRTTHCLSPKMAREERQHSSEQAADLDEPLSKVHRVVRVRSHDGIAQQHDDFEFLVWKRQSDPVSDRRFGDVHWRAIDRLRDSIISFHRSERVPTNEVL